MCRDAAVLKWELRATAGVPSVVANRASCVAAALDGRSIEIDSWKKSFRGSPVLLSCPRSARR